MVVVAAEDVGEVLEKLSLKQVSKPSRGSICLYYRSFLAGATTPLLCLQSVDAGALHDWPMRYMKERLFAAGWAGVPVSWPAG